MSAKLLPILLILFVLVGCQAEQSASVSSGDAATFEPNFDTRPEVNDLLPGDIMEDTETNWIFLSFSDAENHVPTSCQISNRSYVNVTYPCTCAFGACYLKVKPFDNYSGPVSFKYSVTANNFTSESASVSFNVLPISDIPVANNRSISLIENTVYTSDGTISYPDLSGTDPDGNSVTCIKVTDPTSGTVTVNSDCSFTYTPVANYEGSDSFTFKVNDGSNDSLPATVSIDVLHFNIDAIANNITTVVYQNVPQNLTFTFTDPDPGDPWELVIISGPTRGTLSGSGLTRTYTPNTNYIGSDSFTFRIFDGTSHSNLATVSINVLPTTIYLSTTGNDATAVVNDSGAPFLTAQAAANAASALMPTASTPVYIEVGPGTFGNLNFSYNFGSHIFWRGAGAGTTIIGNITANGFDGAPGVAAGDPALGDYDGGPGTDAFDITINSDFTLTFGNVSANGGNGGVHAQDGVLDNLEKPGDPGVGGTVDLTGYFGTISALGGDGHAGGAGGSVRLRAGSTSLSINVSGGYDLCTTASQCGTAQVSGHGGSVRTDVSTVVTGNITAKGGENLGNLLDDVYVAGNGGAINIYGTVNGNVEANGGDTYDAQVGEGGLIQVQASGVVTGDVSVLTGMTSNAGDPNYAGDIVVSGSVQDMYAHAHPFGGGGGTVIIRGTGRDIFVQGYGSSCTTAAAGVVTVYIPAFVRNIDASGGNYNCSPSTSGFINIFGTVTGTASVNGGDSTSADPPGTAGFVRLNNGANVNIVTANGGNAGAGTGNDGGDGGLIVTYPVSTYNVTNFSVTGGSGDTGNGNVSGANGQIIEN